MQDARKPGYHVDVDDNYHYQDESERYRLGTFPTCAAATAACQRIVDKYLKAHYKRGMTAEALWRSYVSSGEDPFIHASDDPTCTFSAWTYARARCEALCGPPRP
jgi:hypothetical protein